MAKNIVREVSEAEAAGGFADMDNAEREIQFRDHLDLFALEAVREAFAYGYGAATLRAEGLDGLTTETVGTEAFDAMSFDGVNDLADPSEETLRALTQE